jgi:hypothetical protein
MFANDEIERPLNQICGKKAINETSLKDEMFQQQHPVVDLSDGQQQCRPGSVFHVVSCFPLCTSTININTFYTRIYIETVIGH